MAVATESQYMAREAMACPPIPYENGDGTRGMTHKAHVVFAVLVQRAGKTIYLAERHACGILGKSG